MGVLTEIASSTLDFISRKLLGPASRGLGTIMTNMLYRGIVATGSLFTNLRICPKRSKSRTY